MLFLICVEQNQYDREVERHLSGSDRGDRQPTRHSSVDSLFDARNHYGFHGAGMPFLSDHTFAGKCILNFRP